MNDLLEDTETIGDNRKGLLELKPLRGLGTKKGVESHRHSICNKSIRNLRQFRSIYP